MKVHLCGSWLVPPPVLLGFLPRDPHAGQSRTELGHRCCGRSASLSLRECVPFLGQAEGGLGCPSSWAGWWGRWGLGAVQEDQLEDARWFGCWWGEQETPPSPSLGSRMAPQGTSHGEAMGGGVKNSSVVPPISATSSLSSGLGGVSTVDRKPRVDACSPPEPPLSPMPPTSFYRLPLTLTVPH